MFIVILFGGYSAGWFYVADRFQKEIDRSLAAVNKGSISADCANAEIRGFPFRLGLYCDAVGYGDDAKKVYATAGSFRSAAQIYQPTHVVAELDPPLRVSVPGIVPLWLDWDNLKSSVRLATPLPQRVSVEAEGLSGQTDPGDDDDSEPASLFSAEDAQVHLRPNGPDLDAAASFVNLQVDPDAVGGRQLPVMNGDADMTLKDGAGVFASRPESLRGKSGEIRRLELSSGNAAVSVSGPLSVGADGLVDAELTIKVRDPKGVAALAATAFPEAKSRIDQGFSGLALLGNEPSLPLKIVKGEMTLGFIPLGKLEPLK
jgi:hypothetical protein